MDFSHMLLQNIGKVNFARYGAFKMSICTVRCVCVQKPTAVPTEADMFFFLPVRLIMSLSVIRGLLSAGAEPPDPR